MIVDNFFGKNGMPKNDQKRIEAKKVSIKHVLVSIKTSGNEKFCLCHLFW